MKNVFSLLIAYSLIEFRFAYSLKVLQHFERGRSAMTLVTSHTGCARFLT